ncbi:hypothetical protein TK90_2873 (plasmid) [Thioalkalivibrio sp. K90mix]|uniref:hypothetical protein n=1 Tax=Thioalkalivibrio sp. (strain K90mix) TaxID=396595 RepID=UPI000195A949|nr:hypothetical protein [Thioalkalivibrio sp. K90mix]ADC73357.1 hypothetical protein TK90_2873 [Thioalkalivibrio sp. K90mix]
MRNAVAIRSLEREDGASVHWIEHRASNQTYEVNRKPPTAAGRERPPKVRSYPNGALPTDMLLDLIHRQQQEGFSDVFDRGQLVMYAGDVSRIIQGVSPEVIPLKLSVSGNRQAQNAAYTLLCSKTPGFSKCESLGRFLRYLASGSVEDFEVEVQEGSLAMAVMSFFESRMDYSDMSAHFRAEKGGERFGLPSPSDSVFRIWGIYPELEQAWDHPVERRALF